MTCPTPGIGVLLWQAKSNGVQGSAVDFLATEVIYMHVDITRQKSGHYSAFVVTLSNALALG